MKVIIFSDWHIHQFKQYNSNKDRLANCVNVLRDLCEFAQRHGIKHILFAGDLYDTHKVILTEVINAVVEAFKTMSTDFPEIKFIAISGNHDQSTQNLIHAPATTALKHLDLIFPQFYLIDDSYMSLGEGVYVHGIPYYQMVNHFEQALDKACEDVVSIMEKEGGTKHYLLIHQTPEDKRNKMIPFDVLPTNEKFENFDYVYCGHIHARHDFEGTNFSLVGNPIHKDSADAGKDKGFLVRNLLKPEKGHIFKKLEGYPEFILETDMDNDTPENVYVLPVTPDIVISEEKKEVTKNFKVDLGSATIIENFWKLTDLTKDKEILKLGLKYITNELHS